MSARYVVAQSAPNALAAATAETILGITRPAASRARLTEIGVFFDGVTAANVPVLVELMSSDGTLTGTADAVVPEQLGGIVVASDITGEEIFTAEPTVLSLIKPFLVDPNKGRLILQFPLSREIDQLSTSRFLYLRCTAVDIVNVRSYMEFVEQV